MKIQLSELKNVTRKAILYYGYSEAEAEVLSEVMLYAQLRGNNQGVVKLIGKGIPKAKNVTPIRAEKESKVSAFLDGGHNHAMVAVRYATDVAVKKAQEGGLAVVGIHQLNTSSGALGYYARQIADAGLVGIVMCGSMETVAAAGSYEAMFGTNPIAIAVPSTGQPLVYDITTSAMAFFGVVQANTAGQQLPDGIAYDKNGNATTKPADVLDGGALKSFDGSHKGSGLSMMIQALTGPLLDSYFTGVGDVVSNWAGHLIIAFDPELFGGAQAMREGVTAMISRVKAAKKLPGITEVLVPGEKGDRLTTAIGSSGEVEIEDNLYTELKKVAGE
jgi:L-2-hydroxycarboxylate dehydrogenase (NAD+)